MKKIIVCIVLLLFTLSLDAQNLCGSIYTDSGGEFGDYSNNQNISRTLSPLISGGKVTVSFTEFSTEENVDYLKIYDGYPGGNSPLIGTYSGNNSPGTITATSTNGVLTFVFVSNDSVTMPGWKANVTCTPPCTTTNALSYVHGSDPGSIILSWTQTLIPDHWELIIQNPTDPEPTATSTGTVVTTNPYLITGLIEGQGYKFYLRSVCDGNVDSPVSAWKSVTILRYFNKSTNDECVNAIPLIVNANSECTTNNLGFISEASHSVESNCWGGNDVWYSFTATSTRHIITLVNDPGSLAHFTLYKGPCGNLTQVGCYYFNTEPAAVADYDSFEVGATYYIMPDTDTTFNNIYSFNICIITASSCPSASLFCGSTTNEPYIFANATNVPSGPIACLQDSKNPTFFTLKITETGPLVFAISQNESFDPFGNPTGTAHDVDFVVWGPFATNDNCSAIAFESCTCPPNNITSPNFYPYGNIVDCSYANFDTAPTETMHIPNAVAGQYYKMVVTNVLNNPGFIKVEQTNFTTLGSGRTACADQLQLIAFVDLNSNGIQDVNEYPFNLGNFNYQINNSGETISAASSFGKYNINYVDAATTYDITYNIFPEYSAYYELTPTNYNDVSIALNGGTQFIYFPIRVTQPYKDVSVTITPISQPIAGSNYKNKIVYKNQGNTTASGTISFTKTPGIGISNISQSGTTNIVNGFSYNYSNLGPFESRSILVTLSVPSIPTVHINDLLTTNAAITTTDDINLTNNSTINIQPIVASYDPNDKMEAHGKKILINDFDSTDYLIYTIRFQNTGTSNAVNVRLEDMLESNLDEQSIRMIDASHNYSMERINNKIVWNFEGIQLKPDSQDEAMSKGYVTFKIKPRPGFNIGDIIPNTASIYFDSNPAIITNTFETEFVATLSTASFDADTIALYPNPASTSVHVMESNGLEKISSINVYDLVGKKVINYSNTESSEVNLNVSRLNKGVYLVEITFENKSKFTKKLVIQ